MKDRPTVQAVMSLSLVVMVLFSGFTVQPDVIPPYYIWIYWMNLFAWVIRAVTINEYQSDEYSSIVESDGTTEGEAILMRFGFTFKGEAYEYVWVWYTVLFCTGLSIVSIFTSVFCLDHVRFASGKSLGGGNKINDEDNSPSESVSASQRVSLPAKGATLTFKDVHYTVTASTTKDTIELLKGVSGHFQSGTLTALMGSSGAGKVSDLHQSTCTIYCLSIVSLSHSSSTTKSIRLR